MGFFSLCINAYSANSFQENVHLWPPFMYVYIYSLEYKDFRLQTQPEESLWLDSTLQNKMKTMIVLLAALAFACGFPHLNLKPIIHEANKLTQEMVKHSVSWELFFFFNIVGEN